jgi:uncharacterized protein YndB with AHSA1/START domain
MGAFSDFTAYAKETGSRLSDQPLLLEKTRRLDATQQELFNYVTDFERSSEWIAGAMKGWTDNSNAEIPGQVGAARMLKSLAGEPIREVVKAYDAPRMLAYSAPHPDGGTVVCWLAYGRLASNPGKAWAGKKLFQVALGRGMKNLERKFPPR